LFPSLAGFQNVWGALGGGRGMEQHGSLRFEYYPFDTMFLGR